MKVFNHTYSLLNSKQALTSLQQSWRQGDWVFYKADVKDMFSNIPKATACNLALRLLSKHNICDQIGTDHLFDVVCFALDNYILNDNKCYKQVNGLPMGSCISGMLSDIFMQDREAVFVPYITAQFGVLHYMRYADDILCVIPANTDTTQLHNTFVRFFKPLLFDWVSSPVNMDYLDLNFIISNGDLKYTIFHKITDSGVVLNWRSSCPKCWKLSVLKWFVSRALDFTSSFEFMHDELVWVFKRFVNNNYPTHIILSCIKYKLKLFLSNYNSKKKASQIQSQLLLPYIGRNTCKVKRKLRVTNKQFYHKVVHLGSKIITKDHFTDLMQMPNVVYGFKCVSSNKYLYIGMTTRKLRDRVKEHVNSSKPIGNHIMVCNSCASADIKDLFRILAISSHYKELRIKEAIYIRKLSPEFNQQLRDGGTTFYLKII